MKRVALVSGAARGLARGIALRLGEAGYDIAFTYRPGGTPPDRTELCLRERGIEPLAIAADASATGETARSVRETEERFGRLDVLVHTVGPFLIKRFVRSTFDEYRMLIESNLSSAVEAAFAALPGMRERRFGRLIYFGMNGSRVTAPTRGMALYGAAKAGVVSFARTLALEEAEHGITVNVIEPGDLRDKELDRVAARATPAKNPTGHAGSWEDVADAVRFLVADEVGYLNGMTLEIHGGDAR